MSTDAPLKVLEIGHDLEKSRRRISTTRQATGPTNNWQQDGDGRFLLDFETVSQHYYFWGYLTSGS